ncbi:MAG: Gfo/Idh/MocA family oxidoreductase [Gammaproteobacteria bacterium]|nr:Gfo/Idh/MocA family oxidoreductase [Gammaproteobacteria bacterium]MYF02851.1 Gfo/Idh/MocA family oxidoreductase [Gammaproteobacteria bacterium]
MKVGVCGLGDRLGYLAKVFTDMIPNFDIVCYADPKPTGFRRMDEKHVRRLRGFKDLETMLEKERLDLIMIGSPNVFHCDQLCQALEARVKIFCEKPVVVSEDETLRLLRELRNVGADQIIVGLVLRYAPLYQDLERLNRQGVFGEIISIEAAEHIPPVHGAFFFRDWRRKTKFSGGFLLEKCCHDLDLYAGLVKSRPRRVASFGGNSFFTHRHRHLTEELTYQRWPAQWQSTESSFSGDSDIVDHQVALVEYNNDVRLCFHTNVHTADTFRRFCVIGSNGMVEGDFVRGYLRAHRAVPRECIFDSTYTHDDQSMHYGAEEQMAVDVAEHLEHGTALPVSVLDALEAGLTAIKIDEARRQGKILDLSALWSRFDEAIT